MSDEPIEVTPLHFTQHVAITADAWPQRTVFSEEWLRQPYLNGATVEGDTVRFAIGNGEAEYRLRRDLPPFGGGIVADLVEGNAPANLKSRKAKYETKVSEA
jgi:hypothetical protein